MCPHGYHHNGFMETPALGTQEVRLHIVWIALWSHQSAQTANSGQCIVQIVNVPQRGLPTQAKRVLKLSGQWAKYPKDNNVLCIIYISVAHIIYYYLGQYKMLKPIPCAILVAKNLANIFIAISNYRKF